MFFRIFGMGENISLAIGSMQKGSGKYRADFGRRLGKTAPAGSDNAQKMTMARGSFDKIIPSVLSLIR